MLSIGKLFLVALLTAGTAHDTPSGIGAHRTPPSTPCAATFAVGHVPGHFDRVWELRCVTPLELTANNSTKGT